MYDEELWINKFNNNSSSYMHKILFLCMNYVYKTCNPTILNLPVI